MDDLSALWADCYDVAVKLVVDRKLDAGRDVVPIANSLFAARVAASTVKPEKVMAKKVGGR